MTSNDVREPDADLLGAIAAGDEAAFERLFRSWYGRLADYALGITRESDLAEDAVQEVFVAIWRRRDALPEPAALPGYLHRAVRNRCLNQLRGRRADHVELESVAPPATPPTAESDLEAAELGRQIQRALAKLAPRTREVFLLSRQQQLTYRQIAETLEISPKTVETLMGRALKQLRTLL